ncbi:MAG TPA: ribbon-helix-helix protein, CopG family [Dehalococcoidia bacterium]|nr:ribbon-helix-helix protein, CopG family [Dehalococcoidia bacterium]
MGYARTTVQLDPEQAEVLTELARRHDRSVSYLVRQAVAGYLAEQGFFVPATLGRNTRRALRDTAPIGGE